MLQNQKLIKMRFILRVTSYLQDNLLLDGWTDLHETLGVYSVRPGLLHVVLFDFRTKPKNRKLAVFRKPEVENIETGSRKLSHRKAREFL